MNKDETLKFALDVLKNTASWNASQQYTREQKAIKAIEAALANEALERKAENARELGLDYEPDYKTLWQQMCKRRDDLDKELAATERQVEILSDSLSQLSKQQAKDEPVPVAIVEVFGKDWRLDYMALPVGKHKLYAQQYTYTTLSQRKPLTDDQITLIIADCASSHQHTDIHLARAIEQAHGILGKEQ